MDRNVIGFDRIVEKVARFSVSVSALSWLEAVPCPMDGSCKARFARQVQGWQSQSLTRFVTSIGRLDRKRERGRKGGRGREEERKLENVAEEMRPTTKPRAGHTCMGKLLSWPSHVSE